MPGAPFLELWLVRLRGRGTNISPPLLYLIWLRLGGRAIESLHRRHQCRFCKLTMSRSTWPSQWHRRATSRTSARCDGRPRSDYSAPQDAYSTDTGGEEEAAWFGIHPIACMYAGLTACACYDSYTVCCQHPAERAVGECVASIIDRSAEVSRVA